MLSLKKKVKYHMTDVTHDRFVIEKIEFFLELILVF